MLEKRVLYAGPLSGPLVYVDVCYGLHHAYSYLGGIHAPFAGAATSPVQPPQSNNSLRQAQALLSSFALFTSSFRFDRCLMRVEADFRRFCIQYRIHSYSV